MPYVVLPSASFAVVMNDDHRCATLLYLRKTFHHRSHSLRIVFVSTVKTRQRIDYYNVWLVGLQGAFYTCHTVGFVQHYSREHASASHTVSVVDIEALGLLPKALLH